MVQQRRYFSIENVQSAYKSARRLANCLRRVSIVLSPHPLFFLNPFRPLLHQIRLIRRLRRTTVLSQVEKFASPCPLGPGCKS